MYGDPFQRNYRRDCAMAGNKTALIIGATRGIGRECALRLAKDGFDITGTCRTAPERFAELSGQIREMGREFHALAFDIADRAAAGKALKDFYGEEGAPDVLLYNAGVNDDDLFAFMTPEQWDRVLHTNTDGFFNCVHPLIANMMSRKQGRIIVISSISGQCGQPGQVNYSASKAALIGAVKALAKEVARRKILVNAVAPGFIDTDMTEDLDKSQIREQIPLRRTGSAAEVAGAVSFLAGEDSTYITGQVIAVNGGLFIG